jgi:hypothetical protein
MPGIDFDRLRREIRMEQVLHLIGFEPTSRRGDQWSGSCPLEPCATRVTGNSSRSHRSFSVNVAIERYYCHRCKSRGHQLELWSAFMKQPLHRASLELCRVLGHEVPWSRR